MENADKEECPKCKNSSESLMIFPNKTEIATVYVERNSQRHEAAQRCSTR